VPIGAALLHGHLKRASPDRRRLIYVAAAASAGYLAWLASRGYEPMAAQLDNVGRAWFAMLNFIPGAILFGVTFHELARIMPAVERRLPLASMAGILYYTAITTAKGRDSLLEVGGLLFAAAAIHNALGYVLGYWMSRGLGVTQRSARTVAFEVGLQNGGMASGIAASLASLGTIGLAAAVFSPWMNVTGSILANYWRRRPPKESPLEEVDDARALDDCEAASQQG
jgi:BASS family bile acid:Na+ symporter